MDEYAVYYPVLMIFSQRNSTASASGERVLSVSSATAGNRLDRWLAECLPAVSRSRIQAVIRSGGVLLNGAKAKASQIVRTDDEIVWREPALTPCESARAEEMPLEILFEDDVVAVLNKPAGMVVHPGAGHREGTLVSGLLHYFGKLSNVGGVDRPGIIHRLDKETSGCLVVAKTDAAHRALAAQFASREVVKILSGFGYGFAAISCRHYRCADRTRSRPSQENESRSDRTWSRSNHRISGDRNGGRQKLS